MFRTFLKFVIYVFGMTLVGVIFASLLTNSSSTWNSIDKVSGTATKLFYIWPHIYVSTSDNLYYACDPQQKSCSLVDSSDIPADSSNETCWQKPEIDLSGAPGQVVTSAVISDCGTHGTIERHMIALDNGTIWVKYRNWGVYSTLCPALGGFIGSMFGVIAFLRSIKHNPQEKRKR